MAPGANNVSNDGWSSVSYGWTCGHCGLERLWFSSKLCWRCGAPKPTGAPGAPDARGGTDSEAHVQRHSRPTLHRSIWQSLWTGSKTTSISRIRRSWQQCKLRRSRLGKLTSSPNAKHALQRLQVQSALSALQSRKAAMPKSQTKITELEVAAKEAAEAVDEAKQKAEKLQVEVDKLQTEYDEEVARLVKPSDPVTHLRNTGARLSRPFLEILKPSLSSHSWKQLSQAFPVCWRRPRPRRWRTKLAAAIDMQPVKEKAYPPRRSARPRRQSSWSMSSKRGTFSHLKRHSTRFTALAAGWLPPLPRFWLEKDPQFAIPIRKQPGQLPGQRHYVEIWTVDA